MRFRITLTGLVQGVGLRPKIYRWAKSKKLAGFVRNFGSRAEIELESPGLERTPIESAIRAVLTPPAQIHTFHLEHIPEEGSTEFSIIESSEHPGVTHFPLDSAPCPSCVTELFDPNNRRYLYPFISCTQCGPRYSILKQLPFDRSNTTLRDFPPCQSCQAEYANPEDRRFHAQTISCPACGPGISASIHQAVQALRDGHILAVQGSSGYQLWCDAQNDSAITQLRERKHRPTQPFAIMVPSVAWAQANLQLSQQELDLLQSPAAPIVLVRITSTPLSPLIAPQSADLGIMRPSTPVHEMLLREFASPVIATSGNLHSDTLCALPSEARDRLAGIADFFLDHQLSITHRMDDSIIRVIQNQPQVLRLGRGLAPLTIQTPPVTQSILATGADMKNSFALRHENQSLLFPYGGELGSRTSLQLFQNQLNELSSAFSPHVITHDPHPGYFSTREAKTQATARPGTALRECYHHEAHAWSVIAEHQLQPPALAFIWDGTGLGRDETLWGSEIFEWTVTHPCSLTRVGSLPVFSCGVSNAHIRKPELTLQALAQSWNIEWKPHHPLWTQVLQQNLHTQSTTSMGRFFDAVAVILGWQGEQRFEGEAPMWLEALAEKTRDHASLSSSLPSSLASNSPREWIQELVLQVQAITSDPMHRSRLARGFHHALSQWVLEHAKQHGHEQIILSGGCFQNRLLLDLTLTLLRSQGFKPYWNQRIPPNDGGIAIGQVYSCA